MRFELTRLPQFKKLLKSRGLQVLLLVAMLFGFLFAILSGLAGTPVGNRNFAIVFVWIAWWALLILVAVPFFGRGWCALCPIPLPGEWLQRGAILGPTSRRSSRSRRRWPNWLRSIWLQNAAFTLLALFSSVILTSPRVTAVVLAAMLLLAIGMSLTFERRTFCRYLCPVGGFIGLYAQAAPSELRVRDKRLCAACADKPCYHGSDAGYGCPWDVFPGGLSRNSSCGLCMECLRVCPYDNIAVNLRPFGADLARPARRMDEAFKAFIMVGSALTYAGVLLGPWGALRSAAYALGSPAWFGYAVGFLALLFAILPGLFWLAVRVGWSPSKGSIRPVFAAFAATLVPLGLGFWIAFSLSFVFANASYILTAVSDPFGWGWDLFGSAATAWQPMLTGLLPFLQVGVLLGGLLWAGRVAQRVSRELEASSVPLVAYTGLITLAMLGLLL